MTAMSCGSACVTAVSIALSKATISGQRERKELNRVVVCGLKFHLSQRNLGIPVQVTKTIAMNRYSRTKKHGQMPSAVREESHVNGAVGIRQVAMFITRFQDQSEV